MQCITALTILAFTFLVLARADDSKHFLQLDKKVKELSISFNFSSECEADEEYRISNLGKTWKYPACSCEEIAEKKSNGTSGWYWVQLHRDQPPVLVLCDFDKEFMDKKNWMRVLHLNMSNPQEHCPNSDFRLVTRDNLRLCGRKRGPGCVSMHPSFYRYTYSHVCGSAVGYRLDTTDGFQRFSYCPNCDVNKPYVDGFSVTYGSSLHTRKHLWSFGMYCEESYGIPPNFVGNNTYCETPADPVVLSPENFLHSHDPLFAGRWFCVELPEPTTEPLEFRICSDQNIDNEDAMLEFVELYIK